MRYFNRYTSVFSIACLFPLSSIVCKGEDVIWRSNRQGPNFSLPDNYYNFGTSIPATSLKGRLIFDGPDSLTLTTEAFPFDSLWVKGGTSQLTVNPLQAGVNIVLREGITVERGASVTLNVGVNRFSTNGLNLTFNVHGGGALHLNTLGMMSSTNGSFYKTGGGLLSIRGGSSGGGQTAVYLNDGITELRDGAILSYGSNNAAIVTLGESGSEAQATLRGNGAVNATVVTQGGARALIDASYGALSIAHLDASAGATFRFDLNSFTTLGGSGAFKGGRLMFNFEGGEAGVIYTLLDFGSMSIDLDLLTLNPDYILDNTFGAGGWIEADGMLQVRFAAIPEPGTWALLLVGLGAYRLRIRRRS